MKKFDCFVRSRVVAIFYISVTFLLSGCEGVEPEAKTDASKELEAPLIYASNPYNADPASIAEGKKIFDLKCSQCHGPDAGGGPEAPDLTDKETVYGASDGDMFKTAYYGTDKGMPTWGKDLGADGIWKVIAYIDSLK